MVIQPFKLKPNFYSESPQSETYSTVFQYYGACHEMRWAFLVEVDALDSNFTTSKL